MSAKEFVFPAKIALYSRMNKRLSFSDWLQQELENRGWNQSKLAKQARLPRGTVNNIINKARRPGPDALTALAKALELPPDLLFRKAGLLPPTKEELDDLEKEWMQLLGLATSDEERKELIERARFELQRIRERRARYDAGGHQTP